MRWRLAGADVNRRLIVLGWFCAVTLAVVGAASFSMMAEDSRAARRPAL